MSILKQRFAMHLRLAKGGYTYSYHIVDGEKVVGQKITHAETRTSGETTVYFLGDQKFATARELVAAYEAARSMLMACAAAWMGLRPRDSPGGRTKGICSTLSGVRTPSVAPRGSFTSYSGDRSPSVMVTS